MNLLSSLYGTSLYPKFYWEERETKKKIAAFGMQKSLTSFPKIEKEETWIASIPFDDFSSFPWENWDFPPFYLPTFILIEKNGKIFSKGNLPLEQKTIPSLSALQWIQDLPSKVQWIDQVEKASSQIDKVVLARCRSYLMSQQNSPWSIIKKWKEEQNSSFFFCLEIDDKRAFLGRSPERLYKRENNHLFSEAIAGTISHNERYFSSKDKEEFSWVVHFLNEQFEKLCTQFSSSSSMVIPTANLKHQYQNFWGKLQDAIDDETIVRALHPTPATLGYPVQEAKKFLKNHQSFSRGLYAGAIGYLNAQETDLTVGIRSALIDKEKIHLFTGAGIVAASSAQNEWEELEHKESSFLCHNFLRTVS